VEAVKKFRKGFKSLDEEFRSYVCLKNEEKNTEMVLVWVKEKGCAPEWQSGFIFLPGNLEV
jgi:hypothetical protein